MKNLFKYYFKIIQHEIKMFPRLIGFVFSNKKKAIYVGCTGMRNLGDEVVYSAINKVLCNLFIYKILYSSPKAGKIGRKLFIKEIDYLILGGGTIIKKDLQSGYLKILNDLVVKYPNAKIIVFGAGVADPILARDVGFPTNIEDWSSLLNKCYFIAVRGILSQQILKSKEWAVKNEVYVLHDPAIYYANSSINQKPKIKKIGLNFCDIAGRIYGKDPKIVEKFVNNLITRLIDDSWEIVLYPTVSTDINYMTTIIDKKLLQKISIYYNYTNIQESLSFFNDIDVFIGQRLHSIIFSSITYTPFHAIEYEAKTSDFLLSLGLKGYSSRTDNLNVEVVLDRINYVYSNIDDEQKKLFNLCEKANKELKDISSNFNKYI
jgi:polysaccharide pyruvyl transferase WcaK-like protein